VSENSGVGNSSQDPGYQAGYGGPMPAPIPAPARAPRGRIAVFGIVASLGLAALIVASAVIVLGVGKSHVQTGTIVFQVQVPSGQSVTDSQLTTIVDILNARIHTQGVDATAEKQQPDQVLVRVNGGADATSLASSIGATGKLEFILLPKQTYGTNTEPGSQPIPADGTQIDPSLPAQFTGSELDQNSLAAVTDVNNPGSWQVNFAFTAPTADQFSTWTGQHVGEYFVIALDRRAVSVPYILAQITGGAGQISGTFTQAEANSLVATLKSGALPYPLQVVSISSVQTATPR
jgi:preprotein translocase subunit SecD